MFEPAPAIDRATLLQWLADARQAYHDLMTGARAVELKHGQKVVTYQKTNAHDLRAYIARLEAQIRGVDAPSGVGVIF